MYRHPVFVWLLAGSVPVATGILGPVFDYSENTGPPQFRRQSIDHPLVRVLDFARSARRQAQQHAGAFECQLIKRERIDGELQTERIINLRVVEEKNGGQDAVSIRMDFLTPDEVAGRRILFREGRNDNKMLVRKGGARFRFLTLELDPHGYRAHAESLMPIAEISFPRILAGMIRTLERQIEMDPTAENTQVQWLDQATLEGERCQCIRITHPRRDESLKFHIAAVYFDHELGMPIRVEAHDWPAQPGAVPLLIAEYSFRDLSVNAPIDPKWFEPDSFHQN